MIILVSAQEVIKSNSDRVMVAGDMRMGAGDVLGSGGDMMSCDMIDRVTTYTPGVQLTMSTPLSPHLPRKINILLVSHSFTLFRSSLSRRQETAGATSGAAGGNLIFTTSHIN